MTIRVQEIFGPTVQGEGHWTGKSVYFVRLHGCPVGCYFCDTGYSQQNDYGRHLPRSDLSVEQIVDRVSPASHVVISGGEPFAQAELPALCAALLIERGKFVSIETSGVTWREVSPAVWITLSPKQHLFEDGRNTVDDRFWQRADEIKLVISDGTELDYYRRRGKLPPLFSRTPLYLQPEWRESDEPLAKTLQIIATNPETTRLSLQTHKFIGVE
ncbi:MAG: 7-carboxy-7-deazaguanine synthase QueE [Cyanobacteria bacterium J06607_13]